MEHSERLVSPNATEFGETLSKIRPKVEIFRTCFK